MKRKCKTKKHKLQIGGYSQFANFNTEPTLEIENNEYIFDPNGIGENNFQMLDSTGKKFISKYGFLAKGRPHDTNNEGGIKVKADKGYVASSYLGVDGKKANKNNPSVASTMLQYGGKVLAKYADKDWDKFGINKNNPNALKHHLNMMSQVRDEAEFNKSFNKAQDSLEQAKYGLDIELSNNINMLTKKQRKKLPISLQSAIMRSKYAAGGYNPSHLYYPQFTYGGFPMYANGGYNPMAPFFSANTQRMTNMHSPAFAIHPYRSILGQYGAKAQYGANVPMLINPYKMQMGGMGMMPQGMNDSSGEMPMNQGLNPSQQRMEQYTGQEPMAPQQQGGDQQQMQQQLMQLAMAIAQGDPNAKKAFSQLPPEVQQMVVQMVQQIQQQGQGGGMQ